jgi:hypothetical protein
MKQNVCSVSRKCLASYANIPRIRKCQQQSGASPQHCIVQTEQSYGFWTPARIKKYCVKLNDSLLFQYQSLIKEQSKSCPFHAIKAYWKGRRCL